MKAGMAASPICQTTIDSASDGFILRGPKSRQAVGANPDVRRADVERERRIC
jgi:hypothetical protein